jgi:hypothetical protein
MLSAHTFHASLEVGCAAGTQHNVLSVLVAPSGVHLLLLAIYGGVHLLMV